MPTLSSLDRRSLKSLKIHQGREVSTARDQKRGLGGFPVKQRGRGEVKDTEANKCSSVNHCMTGTNGLQVGLGDVDKGVLVIP